MSVPDPLGGLAGSADPEGPQGPESPEDPASPGGRDDRSGADASAGPDAPPAPAPGSRLARRKPAATPSTFALLAVLGAFFAVQLYFSPLHDGADPLLLYRMGSLHAASIRDGDFFRLGSYAFLHVGVAHFLINAYALWILMRPLEASLGGAVALGIFAGAALLGGAASAAHADLTGQVWQQAAGASGGIFGLFGATGALWFRLRHHLPRDTVRAALRSLLVNLLINAAIAFIAPVDSFAHAGGFVGGALLALVAPMPALPPRAWHAPVRWLLVSTALALAAMEGAAVARAVHPRDRLLRGEGVEARVPFFLPQVAPGEAVGLQGLSARIYRDTEPAAKLGPARELGGRRWTEASAAAGGADGALGAASLEAPAGAGRVAVEVRCYTPACIDQARPLAERLAESLVVAR